MFDQVTRRAVVAEVQAHWTRRCKNGAIAPYMQLKERGHGLADFVEGETVALLEASFGRRAAHEFRAGARRARSMGDIWIESGGIFNPVNVKSGVKEPGGRPSAGQPNLVSLAKLTNAVLKRWIDSYYLLFVKFVAADPVTADVSLADLFHVMAGYTHFDAGTGQVMLQARKFDTPPADPPEPADPKAVLEHMLERRERGNEALRRNREQRLSVLRAAAAAFDPTQDIEQTELGLEAAG